METATLDVGEHTELLGKCDKCLLYISEEGDHQKICRHGKTDTSKGKFKKK